jgi:hypothetical protein
MVICFVYVSLLKWEDQAVWQRTHLATLPGTDVYETLFNTPDPVSKGTV